MKWSTSLLVVLLWVSVPSITTGQAVTDLNSPYRTLTGDMAAITLSELIKLRTDFKDPTLVTFEPADTLIDVEIYGNPGYGSKTDRAREVVGMYWDFIQAAHIPYMERRFGIQLSELQYRIIYYDRNADPEEQLLLQFVQGHYLLQ